MRKLVLALATAAIALGAADPAAADLSPAEARLGASIAAFDHFDRFTWAGVPKIGTCTRQSRKQFICAAKIDGDEFKGCLNEPPFTCSGVFHACKFKVTVKEAGFTFTGRVHSISCTAERHS